MSKVGTREEWLAARKCQELGGLDLPRTPLGGHATSEDAARRR